MYLATNVQIRFYKYKHLSTFSHIQKIFFERETKR